MSQNGMVATSHPLAAQTGVDILRAGGTAADAAIAANAVLGVVEPMSCGIGGDLFVMYWDASKEKLCGLNASGRSPLRMTRELFLSRDLQDIPDSGPLSWSVPGCVDGWDVLQRRFGKMSLAQVLQPAISFAERGFPVSEIIGSSWKSAVPGLSAWPSSASTYLQNRAAPRAGQIVGNERLAQSYRKISEGGRDAFYTGHLARALVEFSDSVGGLLSTEDLARHHSDWIEPVSTRYRGVDVWELPPNGQGLAALEMLNLLEHYDLEEWGPTHPDYVHLFVEAKKLAFADRARFYADMDFCQVPVADLISKTYASAQKKRITMDQSAVDVLPGDPKLSHGDTVYLTVVDRDRNCCSFIQSIYYGFGSQVVAGDLGFALQNHACLSSLQEDHPNSLEPGKRPFHTIIPAMVTQKGKPQLCFGVMGGDMQPQGHVQILVNMLNFGMNVQEAGDMARIQHFGSATPTGRPMSAKGGQVALESGFPQATINELERRGHHVIHKPGAFGGYQGIFIDQEQGSLQGGSDPRKDGCAMGY